MLLNWFVRAIAFCFVSVAACLVLRVFRRQPRVRASRSEEFDFFFFFSIFLDSLLACTDCKSVW